MSFVVESFTDTNGTALESHTGEAGATWTEHPQHTAGSAVITSNSLYCALGIACFYASGTPASADYSAEAVIAWLSSTRTRAAVCVRMDTTASTLYRMDYEQTGTVFRLIRRVGAVDAAMLATYTDAAFAAVGQTRTMRIGVSGTGATVTINGYLDNVLVMTAADTNAARITATGRAGIWMSTSSTVSTGQQLQSFAAADSGATAVNVQPSAIASTATVGSPTITRGSAVVAPARIESTAAVFAPTILHSATVVAPAFITSTAVVYSPAIIVAASVVQPDPIAGSSIVFEPTIPSSIRPGYVTIMIEQRANELVLEHRADIIRIEQRESTIEVHQ